jgi:hypothetical protein
MLAAIAAAALWVLYVVWQSPHRIDLATYGAFAAAVVTLATAWISWAWRVRTSPAGRAATGQDLDRLGDLLAVAVKQEWERAAGERGLLAEPIPVTWGRPSRALAGPVAAATGSRRFDPLPGVPPAQERQLATGQLSDLHAVYGGLGSGRLVIAGAPGSGKSGAAVLLVLAAIKYREQVSAADGARVPVPVLFTAQDWDPRRQRIADWLVSRLQLAYPMFAGKTGAAAAAALVGAGKVAVILDGLDEIAKQLRPAALRALSQQATFRLVVLSRTAEMASAATRHGVLADAAAIELSVIDPATAADYLERVQLAPPPEGWRDLIDRIRSAPGSPLAKALDSPLTLTLVRDTYRAGDDARELLKLCDSDRRHVSSGQAAEQITGHLLDRVLPAAYAHRLGEPAPRYDLATAQRALAKIAARMNQDGTRDLQWWRLPEWAPTAPRVIITGLGGALVGGLVGALVGGLVGALGDALGGALVGGLVGALGGGLGGALADMAPPRIGNLRIRQALSRNTLWVGLVFGLVLGVAAGVGLGVAAGLVAGLTAGLVGWLGFGRVGLEDLENTSSPSPVTSWRNNRSYALALGVVAGVVAGVGLGLVAGLGSGRVAGHVAEGALGVGLAAGLSNSQVWLSSLAAAQLAMRWHTPMRLIRFLGDARERNVLRTVGPVYQFRHARLQDRLANASADCSAIGRRANANSLPDHR